MQEFPPLDFSDKILFIYKSNSENDIALESPQLLLLGGRYFLVGRVPDGGSSNDWLAGLTSYVAWDEIEEFIVFDSLEDFFTRLSQSWSDSQLQ